MKKLIIALVLILSIGTVSAGTYTLVTANYPILVNGTKLSVQPLNMNGATYLPLRSISEAVGVPINWNNSTRTVEINTVDVEKLKEACVMLYAYGDGMTSQGSGVYVDYDQVLTAYHVVDQDRNMIWDSDDKTATFSAINFDPNIDIATLKASKEVKPIKIGDSDEIKSGDQVIVVGAPQYKADTVIYGKVVSVDGSIFISPAIKGGGSGSAAFDLSGNLIGIVIAADDGLNETQIVPINLIREKL